MRNLPTPLALAAAMACCPAHADISDTLKPYVTLGATYDDNLLRLPDNTPPGIQRSDRATHAIAGVMLDRPIGRQKLTGEAKVSRVSFDHYDQLNYSGKDFSLDWAWVLGKYFDGNIGGSYQQVLTPFNDFHSDERNLRTQRREYANGGWRLHPSWRLHAGFQRDRFDYELAAQSLNNRKEDRSEAGIDYLASSGSKVGVVLRHIKGGFLNPRRIGATFLDQNYTQDELKANINWLYSDITQLQLLAGYAKRKHDTFSERDTSGLNGRATLNWRPRAKLRFNFDAWREFSAVESIVVNNSVNRGASVNATWDISAKVQANAGFKREKRKFERLPYVFFNGDPSDTTRSTNMGVVYQPARKVLLSLTGYKDRRTGTPLAGTGSYKAKGVSLMATLQF
ncbi:XrtB/PEP-CTERM-associated polysaccharide biosynthesis outer membrane protein EpsL [Pseudoduganella violaceinigra]|uniref:XrtB/PEP-CTERM-associated polysaccharide biosynthesis outer membrane protein EpsL n=1 Tax=Pseudoduganella violaceinigra TaxID=246602 RepID=UPI00041E4E9C|nr:XrtB/PEP-CTERM-associated polysaccharide biosynthesis outer membrane protein EpsL [Pseudoduganella violaceinigra]